MHHRFFFWVNEELVFYWTSHLPVSCLIALGMTQDFISKIAVAENTFITF